MKHRSARSGKRSVARYPGLIETFVALLDSKVRAGKIGKTTRRTYINNASRILEAFIRNYSEEEILQLVRSSTSASRTNAETLRVIRLLKQIVEDMPRRSTSRM